MGSTLRGKAREDGVYNQGVHILTPVTEGTSYHIVGLTRNYALADAELTRSMLVGLTAVNNTEDLPMLLSCQEEMAGETDLLALNPVMLHHDVGVVRARRMFNRALQEEENI